MSNKGTSTSSHKSRATVMLRHPIALEISILAHLMKGT